jgi:hypothetical protein
MRKIKRFHAFRVFLHEPRAVTEMTKDNFNKVFLVKQDSYCAGGKRNMEPCLDPSIASPLCNKAINHKGMYKNTVTPSTLVKTNHNLEKGTIKFYH